MQDGTIVAISTGIGGALSVIRLSGDRSFDIVNGLFSKRLDRSRHAYFGMISYNDELIDEVVVVGFRGPNSFTGEDCVEISCHGSRWITNQILRVCIICGARMATAGEFTQRAFLNGKMDLSQAEAVGDLIASQSRSAAQVALSQMRGGYSKELADMRDKLLNIKSLIELELDFGDEDVEFASRDDLRNLLIDLKGRCERLANSFSLGNVLKNGIPVAIIGKPNVGKSTLLNCLVGDDRAIVSEIAGTTRDYLEEVVNIDGIEFRFVDTAGIRATDDRIEAIGVERSMERIKMAKIVLQLVDEDGFERLDLAENQFLLVINTKCDQVKVAGCDLSISAKYGNGIDALRDKLIELSGVGNYFSEDGLIVSNVRHYESLRGVILSVDEALEGLSSGLSGDLISFSLGSGIDYLGEITGVMTTDEVLGRIFSSFCIGK